MLEYFQPCIEPFKLTPIAAAVRISIYPVGEKAMTSGLSQNVKSRSRELGILEVGICSSDALSENRASLDQMLPDHRSVVCILVPHCQAALAST